MFLKLFLGLRAAGVPVSLPEHLDLIAATAAASPVGFDFDRFHALARACLVKDVGKFDRFDRVFGEVVRGIAANRGDDAEPAARIPADWLRAAAERVLSDEDKARVAALGGWDALMETLRQRLAEQRERHQGGNKWIGAGGTSPFGAMGYNPEGVRILQPRGREGRAVRVWDARHHAAHDDSAIIGTRAMQVALRRLRHWARQGGVEEFDLAATISGTARKGYLDVRTRPERRNAVRVLLLLDIGGSMDEHSAAVGQLFSAARHALRHLDVCYFHNCVYERVWRDSERGQRAEVATQTLLQNLPRDTRLVIVGDAAMSPYELTHPNGSVEHLNREAGLVWLSRLVARWPRAVWLNPLAPRLWDYTHSVGLVARAMGGRMHPLTLTGLDAAMRDLDRRGAPVDDWATAAH